MAIYDGFTHAKPIENLALARIGWDNNYNTPKFGLLIFIYTPYLWCVFIFLRTLFRTYVLWKLDCKRKEKRNEKKIFWWEYLRYFTN